jgi:hypothetical protein
MHLFARWQTLETAATPQLLGGPESTLGIYGTTQTCNNFPIARAEAALWKTGKQ